MVCSHRPAPTLTRCFGPCVGRDSGEHPASEVQPIAPPPLPTPAQLPAAETLPGPQQSEALAQETRFQHNKRTSSESNSRSEERKGNFHSQHELGSASRSDATRCPLGVRRHGRVLIGTTGRAGLHSWVKGPPVARTGKGIGLNRKWRTFGAVCNCRGGAQPIHVLSARSKIH